MIYTCTISPSIDYTTYLTEFRSGELNRTNDVFYYPGGKGINVSRVLNRLDSKTKALGFLGGFTGDYIEQFLKNETIATDFIKTSDITRINVKIKADHETELNGPGPTISEVDQEQLIMKVTQFKAGDWFVLAGSLPQLSDPHFYYKLAEQCKKRDVNFVLDTSGSALKELIKSEPFLIKPNREELGELFDVVIKDIDEAIYYAKQLLEFGIRFVIVSLGGEGALLVSENESLVARAPIGNVINTVGAGDSLVAGFLASFSVHQNVCEAFQYGVATGSATAFKTDLAQRQDVEVLRSQVKVNKIYE